MDLERTVEEQHKQYLTLIQQVGQQAFKLRQLVAVKQQLLRHLQDVQDRLFGPNGEIVRQLKEIYVYYYNANHYLQLAEAQVSSTS
jgi:hypothetical protein